MLISLDFLVNKYGLKDKIRGIIHIGAHECEEKQIYDKHNIANVYWIEGMRSKVNIMKNKLPNINIYNAVISDTNGENVTLKIANNGQSSSILELGTHKKKHPGIRYISQENHVTKTMDTLIEEEKINIDNINFINLDIQGNELRALKGMEKNLSKIDYIYTEVNIDYLYINCCLMKEIDDYLSGFGFKRVETKILNQFGWGDAFYIKNVQ